MTLLTNLHQVIKRLNKANPYQTFADMAEYAGLSTAGMHDSLKNGSIKLKTLEKIAEFYDISIIDILKMALEYNEATPGPKEPQIKYESKEKTKLLEEELRYKNEQIEHYQQMLQFYKNQLNNENPKL